MVFNYKIIECQIFDLWATLWLLMKNMKHYMIVGYCVFLGEQRAHGSDFLQFVIACSIHDSHVRGTAELRPSDVSVR